MRISLSGAASFSPSTPLSSVIPCSNSSVATRAAPSNNEARWNDLLSARESSRALPAARNARYRYFRFSSLPRPSRDRDRSVRPPAPSSAPSRFAISIQTNACNSAGQLQQRTDVGSRARKRSWGSGANTLLRADQALQLAFAGEQQDLLPGARLLDQRARRQQPRLIEQPDRLLRFFFCWKACPG